MKKLSALLALLLVPVITQANPYPDPDQPLADVTFKDSQKTTPEGLKAKILTNHSDHLATQYLTGYSGRTTWYIKYKGETMNVLAVKWTEGKGFMILEAIDLRKKEKVNLLWDAESVTHLKWGGAWIDVEEALKVTGRLIE